MRTGRSNARGSPTRHGGMTRVALADSASRWPSLIISLVTALLLASCDSAPTEGAVASCEELAQQQASLLLEAIDAAAEMLASEDGAARDPSGFADEPATPTAIASALASGTPSEDRVARRAHDLRRAASDGDCDQESINSSVVERVEVQMAQFASEVDDRSGTSNAYVALNLMTFVRLHLQNELNDGEGPD